MNKAMLTVGIIVMAIFGLALINIVSSYSTGQELDYYLLKETTEAAMTDSLDVGYYRLTGETRIDKEKFVESFLRRFSDSVDQSRYYDIRLYDINETPPKVSIKIDSSTSITFASEDLDITTNIDAIIESNYKKDILTKNLISQGKLGQD